MNTKILLPLLLSLLETAATAAPTLRTDVSVVGAIVTVGDMFDESGSRADHPLIRSPAPGTSGLVSLEAVRTAAAKAGLIDYSDEGVDQVRVERPVTVIGPTELADLVTADLAARGVLPSGVEAVTRFDDAALSFDAEA